MNILLFSFFVFILLFIFIIAIQSVIFLIVCKRKEKKWNEKFYQKVEVFKDSHIAPSVVWSFLTDPEKLMSLNYKDKIKWVDFEQPLKMGSPVRIKIRKGYIFRGFLSSFDYESKIRFEYHVWPNATRYIFEIDMIKLECKTRFILRIKVKKFLIPLIKKLYPKIDERMKNLASNLLTNFLMACEEKSAAMTNH